MGKLITRTDKNLLTDDFMRLLDNFLDKCDFDKMKEIQKYRSKLQGEKYHNFSGLDYIDYATELMMKDHVLEYLYRTDILDRRDKKE